ncbi:ABC transporter substrate-binding protein [Paenibacillus sp. L3-i20]|uniref:ABC transporter substrate-binding protein n=1 Tax=Paenibacillus sp. L3-i20 TaxID=2905833 RepID=UPI001EDFC4EA|nr:ABC transporter substrate-binding protein [Paenibacillus sp. L3-i20]GKU78875.1 hypothetical protein L3i20_v232720 [Paenibacillus sp. L3-i20]
MKKWINIVISLIVILSLSACNNNTPATNKPESTKDTSTNISSPSPNVVENKGVLEDENKEDKKTIVISTLGVTEFFEQAKQRYESAHPNVTIQFKEFGSETNEGGALNAAAVEKYIKQTTTEVLSGQGADLFVLSSVDLPIDKYVSKKAFVDVYDVLHNDKSFDSNLYYMNILDNSKMDGGLYLLPTSFYLQTLFGDTVNLEKTGVTIDDKNWTWSHFVDVGKQLANKGDKSFVLGGSMEPERMLNLLVSDNYAQLVDGSKHKANFDSVLFTDLLKRVKSLYSEKLISDKPVTYEDSYFNLSEFYTPKDYFSRLILYYKDGSIYQKPHTVEQQSGIAFGGMSSIAMNANSKLKGTAWDFMKFLLSEEMQTLSPENGFSLLKSVNEATISELANQIANGEVIDAKVSNLKASEKDIQILKTMLAEASLPITPMNKVQLIVAEEAKAYFSGQKSEDAVAKLIQNRVTTYLNE